MSRSSTRSPPARPLSPAASRSPPAPSPAPRPTRPATTRPSTTRPRARSRSGSARARRPRTAGASRSATPPSCGSGRGSTQQLGGARIVNSGTASFVSDTLGQSGSVKTPDAVAVDPVAGRHDRQVARGQVQVGERTPFKLVVRNVGDAPTLGKVTVTDELPAELSFRGDPGGSGWDCDVGRDLVLARRRARARRRLARHPVRRARRRGRRAQGEIVDNTAVVRGRSDERAQRRHRHRTAAGAQDRPGDRQARGRRAVLPGRAGRVRPAGHEPEPNRATGVRVRDVLPPASGSSR